MLTNFPANIPISWLRDIATIGTSSHTYYRHSLWNDWTIEQRIAALNYYSNAIDVLSKAIDVVEDLHDKLGDNYSCVMYSFESVTGINCSEHYTCKELTNAILAWQQREESDFNNAIKEWQELFD